MTSTERRWDNARWLKRAAVFECGVAALALALLLLFASQHSTLDVVLLVCVAVLATSLAVVFSLRCRALGRRRGVED